MTAAEVMRDVAMWVAPGASHYGKLGAIAYVEGQWQLHDQPIPQEDARRYLIGWLQEWWEEREKVGSVPCSAYQAIRHREYGTASLPALWEAYKRIMKIEIS